MIIGGPRLKAHLIKVVLGLESFFCDQTSECILKFTLKSPAGTIRRRWPSGWSVRFVCGRFRIRIRPVQYNPLLNNCQDGSKLYSPQDDPCIHQSIPYHYPLLNRLNATLRLSSFFMSNYDQVNLYKYNLQVFLQLLYSWSEPL